MQTKYRLPSDVRIVAISYIKGYSRRVLYYQQRRDEIINSTPCTFSDYDVITKGNKETRRQYFPHGSTAGNPSEQKALALQELEELPEVKRMRVVENALCKVGDDLLNKELRCDLQDAIWKSCLNRKQFPYERFYLPGISKRSFQQRKIRLLYEISSLDMLI